ncbi:KDO transferase [Pontimonas salivibrio]|uniref:KDO transferase n=1 Tax=Pontimonas salivibrio TaxID=1159327 RepID=A0A2L2BSC3_9MICO|nr:hypothetical protein [Pontimonas salivibrio]AVG24584.1 KDO transferase [Pontimonas salivibrio]
MASDSWARFEESKERVSNSESLSYFERYSSPHSHPGGAIWRTVLQKFRVLALFLTRRIAQSSGKAEALQGMRQLEGSAAGKEVLLLASGPSADKINTREVATRQKAGELVVVATNYFLHSPLAKTITPDFLVWSDSVFHPAKKTHNAEAWQRVEDTPSVRMVMPWTWRSIITTMSVAERTVYFDNDSLEGWSTNTSPLHPRGYQGSTGVKALGFALHLEPRQVFVIGLDLSYFQSFRVDSDNRVVRQPTHLQGTDSGIQDITPHTINGIADSLYSTANQFLSLRQHFSGHPIINLDPDSLVDAFPKVIGHPLVKKSAAKKPSAS